MRICYTTECQRPVGFAGLVEMPTRASKRKRMSESRLDASDIDNKHVIFTEWAKKRGVEVNGVKAAELPGRGVGLVASKHLEEGNRLLFIPEKAMFNPDASLLQREKLDRASPQAQLAVSAMATFQEAKSPMKLWEQVWPSRDSFEQSMPMCWPRPLQQLLPPSVHQPLERQVADYRKDWSAASDFCDKHDCSERDFRYYWMIVNSRSFHWKLPRGKTGSMVLCPFIGRLVLIFLQCMELSLTFVDYMNHGPMGSGCQVSPTAKGYEVTATRDYGKECSSFLRLTLKYSIHSCSTSLFHD